MEAGPAESTGSSSIGAVAPSKEPKPADFKCRRCTKAFRSGPALCGHQNAHRLLTDPSRISPVLAAVLNNPLPGDKPHLIPINPGANKEKLVRKQQRQQPATAVGNESRRYHPYKKLGKDKELLPIQNQAINLMIEETGSSDDISNEKPAAEGEDLLGEQLIQKDANPQPKYHYHPFERAPEPEPLPVYNIEEHPRPKRVTLDLLGEWAPLSGFGGDGQLGTSYRMNAVGDPALEMRSRRTRSSAPLDLELKLGFGPGF